MTLLRRRAAFLYLAHGSFLSAKVMLSPLTASSSTSPQILKPCLSAPASEFFPKRITAAVLRYSSLPSRASPPSLLGSRSVLDFYHSFYRLRFEGHCCLFIIWWLCPLVTPPWSFSKIRVSSDLPMLSPPSLSKFVAAHCSLFQVPAPETRLSSPLLLSSHTPAPFASPTLEQSFFVPTLLLYSPDSWQNWSVNASVFSVFQLVTIWFSLTVPRTSPAVFSSRVRNAAHASIRHWALTPMWSWRFW